MSNQPPTAAPTHPPATSTALAVPQSAAPVRADDFRMMLEPTNFDQVRVMAAMVASTGMFRCISPEDGAIRIMAGRALGLPMFASLKGIYSIQGRDPDGNVIRSVGIESKLKVALALKMSVCEYLRCTERSATVATYVAKRRGEPEFKLSFTIQEAKDAGLFDRGDNPEKQKLNNWNRWTADMLMSKASGKIVDIVFPEACLGLDTTEDLYDAIETTGESVQAQAAPPPPRQAAPMRDFGKEGYAIKEKILAAKTADEKKTIRKDVEKFCEEAGDPWASDVKRFYNTTVPKAEKPAAGAAPTATATAPAQGTLAGAAPPAAQPTKTAAELDAEAWAKRPANASESWEPPANG